MQKSEKFLERAKILITRVGDEGPNFFKRDIFKLSEEIVNNFQAESSEGKETIFRLFVEAYDFLVFLLK